jgi:hypothetical protein
VSLGCIHDEVLAEPGSWLVVGMIPVFDKKKATQTKLQTEDGPMGASRRRIQITHTCIEAFLEGWNALTQNTKVLQWADGLWRRTRIILRAIFSDQPEADTYCCDSDQSCKLCHCPKDKLHEPAEFPPKNASSQERKVNRAADGLLNDKAGCLFRRQGCVWIPLSDNKAAYERQRKALNGTHIMHNAWWGVNAFDVQQMVWNYTNIIIYLEILSYTNVYIH